MTESRRPAVETLLEIGGHGSQIQIPVEMKKIRTSSEITLDTASPDGNPMKQQNVDLVTGEIVQSANKRLGIFRQKPKKSDKATWSGFREISADDLDLIEAATSLDTLVIDHFIPLAEVPMERVTDAYYLAPPSASSPKPLVLLARAMKKKKVAGVFKMTKRSRQYLCVVYEQNGGLIVNTLAWSVDFTAVRDAQSALARQTVKISASEQKMAEHLLELLTTDATVLDTYEDDLPPLRAELIERALQGKTLPKRAKRVLAAVSADADDDLEERLRNTLKAAPPTQQPVTA